MTNITPTNPAPTLSTISIQSPKQQISTVVKDAYFTKAKMAISSAKDKICSTTNDVFQEVFTNGHTALVGSSLLSFFMGGIAIDKDDTPKPFFLAGSFLFGGALLQVGVQKLRQKNYKKATSLALLGGAMAVASAYFLYPTFFPPRIEEIRALIQRDKANQTPCEVLDIFPERGSVLRNSLSSMGLRMACVHMNQTEITSFVNKLYKEIHPDTARLQELAALANEAMPAIRHAHICIKKKVSELHPENIAAAYRESEKNPSDFMKEQYVEDRVCRWA